MTPPESHEPGPVVTLPLRLVRGHATPEEVAALLAVLSAASTASTPAPRQSAARSAWAERGRGLRRPPAPGPGAWRASGLPR